MIWTSGWPSLVCSARKSNREKGEEIHCRSPPYPFRTALSLRHRNPQFRRAREEVSERRDNSLPRNNLLVSEHWQRLTR